MLREWEMAVVVKIPQKVKAGVGKGGIAVNQIFQ